MFLLSGVSLTLMKKASLIALVRFWSSLPTIVKLLMLILWPVVLQWSNIGGRGLLMFLEPFCKISGRFFHVFFITPMFTAFISIYDSTFVCDRILVLGSHKEASDGLSSFKEHLNPKFVACPLLFSHQVLDGMGLPCTSLFCCCSGQFGFFLFCSCLGSGSSFLPF